MRPFEHIGKAAQNRMPQIIEHEKQMEKTHDFVLPVYLEQSVEDAEFLNAEQKEFLAKMKIEKLAQIRAVKANELISTSPIHGRTGKAFEKVAYENGLWFYEDYQHPQNIMGSISKQLKKPNQPVITAKASKTATDYAANMAEIAHVAVPSPAREVATPAEIEARRLAAEEFWNNAGSQPDYLHLPVSELDGPDELITLFKAEAIHTLADLMPYRDLQDIPAAAERLDPDTLDDTQTLLALQGVVFYEDLQNPALVETLVNDGTEHWIGEQKILPPKAMPQIRKPAL